MSSRVSSRLLQDQRDSFYLSARSSDSFNQTRTDAWRLNVEKPISTTVFRPLEADPAYLSRCQRIIDISDFMNCHFDQVFIGSKFDVSGVSNNDFIALFIFVVILNN